MLLALQFSCSYNSPLTKLHFIRDNDLCLFFFQEHEETSMEGVQICGVNNSSPQIDREDNKRPLKFGESVVSVNILKFPNFRKGPTKVMELLYYLSMLLASEGGLCSVELFRNYVHHWH